jgi:exopolysaccharide biosynthesis polyprenyl glycosylphosphotransferase
VVVADGLILLVALFVAWWGWSTLGPPRQYGLLEVVGLNAAMPPGLVLVGAWLFFLRGLGFYDPGRMVNLVRSLGALSQSTLEMLLVIVTFQFLAQQDQYSRMLVLGFLGTGFLGLAVWRAILLRIPLDLPSERVAVVGVGQDAATMQRRMARHSSGYFIVGFIEPEVQSKAYAVKPAEVLGALHELRELVNEHRLETLILATRHLNRQEALQLARHASHMGLRVLQVPFSWGIASPRMNLAALGSMQLLDLGQVHYPTAAETLKRIFDVVAVVLLGSFLVPWLVLVGVLVRFDSEGPALYSSPRVGRGGRTFAFLKFRSMVRGADQDRPAGNESDGPLFKMTDDPRLTRLGRWLRRSSIDELPQLWNVLRGDMNLVGPRPLPVEDLAPIEEGHELWYWFELRHQVKPGITGLWQVSGRSDLGFQEMVELDLHYIQNWSPWLDLKILLQTVPAVLRGRGAR